VVWVGAGKPYLEDSALCPACGHVWDTRARSWSCDGCGSTRPLTTWDLAGDRVLTVCGQGFPLALGLPGRASASNAVMAAAAAHAWGVPLGAALAQMSSLQQVDGRYARYRVGVHDTQLVLAKNPASWLEALDLVRGDGRTVVLSVNARTPDGADPSWLWDVPFEQLRGRKVVASGERSADLAVRLLYAEVACTVEPDALSALRATGEECVVIANYSAFVGLRSQLRMSA
jgi:UDP-N-acetylmuramyl tripeptide synthase